MIGIHHQTPFNGAKCAAKGSVMGQSNPRSNFSLFKRSVNPVEKAREISQPTDSLESIKKRVLAVSTDGSLQAQIRHIVAENRQKAEHREAA